MMTYGLHASGRQRMFLALIQGWESEESEDVLWEADRLLDAYLYVSSILQQRFRQDIDGNDPLVHAGLKWH
ncbi:hypothetical protein OSTOST_07719, partial [Ostertagia ostertagi]